jgi:ABC-type transport system involved in cytochrome bd biosynthesis fused ATPase/permease subunit
MTLIPAPFLVVGGWLFTKKILPNLKEAQRTLAELNAILQDNLSGVNTLGNIKYFFLINSSP